MVLLLMIVGEVCGHPKTSIESNTTKFARLSTKYRYALNHWKKNPTGNYGDCFQGFAVENVYSEMGIQKSDIAWVNRDEIDVYDGEKVVLVMQGWFGLDVPLVWSSCIVPVFLGFHLQKNMHQRFERCGVVENMKNLGQAIGCRDRQTAKYLRSLGIDAYFSGCLTLTFPKRKQKPKNGKVFAVDVHNIIHKFPKNILKDIIVLSQSHSFNNPLIGDEEYTYFEERARLVFRRYSNEARLMITSRIHVALPCLAIGVPVIFIHSNRNDCRFDILHGLVRIYSPREIRRINWYPSSPNIETIKSMVKMNAITKIKEILGERKQSVGADVFGVKQTLLMEKWKKSGHIKWKGKMGKIGKMGKKHRHK